MNIGLLHGFVGGGGGTEKILMAIIDALSETNHNVTLYTFSKPKISNNKISIKSSIPLSIPAFGLYQRAMETKLISKAKNDDIIIQASGGFSLPKNPNQKIIIYCHNDLQSDLQKTNTKYKGAWAWYYKSYYNIVKKFFEKIHDSNIHLISNSEFVQRSINKKFEKNSEIIFPPVDLSEFSPKDKQNSVVTISRFSGEKNLEFALDVMKNIDVHYDLIGNTKTKTNELYYGKLLSKIKNEEIDSVNLLKNIGRSELTKKLEETKIYFHSSEETFGITVVESIAAGCIPIVPDNSAHKETVPFNELRYQENNLADAQEKIKKAINGVFDKFLDPMRESIKIYDKNRFKKLIISYIENLNQT